jgi:hypothetical protein
MIAVPAIKANQPTRSAPRLAADAAWPIGASAMVERPQAGAPPRPEEDFCYF